MPGREEYRQIVGSARAVRKCFLFNNLVLTDWMTFGVVHRPVKQSASVTQ